MLVQTTRTSVPNSASHATWHSPPINADRIWLAAKRRRRCRPCILPEPGDIAHLQRERRDGTRAQPRGAVRDKGRSPSHECRVAQGDFARCVAEMFLYDFLDRLQALQRGGPELFRILHERGGSGSVIRGATVPAAPRTLDKAKHLRVKPIVLVKALRRLAAEKDGLRCGVDKREEEVARDFTEVHPRDELLVRLEVGVYRLAVDLVVERRPGQHGPPVIESAPLGVDHHHATRLDRGVVAEFGNIGNLLEVRAVRARSEYCAKDASTGRVRPRKRSAYRLSCRYTTVSVILLRAEEIQVGIRRSREQRT